MKINHNTKGLTLVLIVTLFIGVLIGFIIGTGVSGLVIVKVTEGMLESINIKNVNLDFNETKIVNTAMPYVLALIKEEQSYKEGSK